MKVLALIAVLLVATSAVQVKRPMTNAQIKQYESLKQGNTWASIMMNLAELHLQAQGPLDQLVDAIEEVIDDIERKLVRADEEYERQTNRHEAEVSRIKGAISSAQEDIASTTEFLNNVLYVQKSNLETDIANLKVNIANTYKYIDEQTELRAQQHARFNQAIVEHNDALEAVYEALDVLSGLDGTPALVQVNKAKKSLDNVQNKISKNVDGSMVKALLAMTTGEFANSEALSKVRDLLNDVAGNLTKSIAKFNEDEEFAQTSFEVDVKNKEAEINRMQIDLTEKGEQLEQTIRSIASNEEFLALRQKDLKNYQQDLVDENDAFDRITAMYEDLVAELQSEQAACNEALGVLDSADIAGYIGGRMEQDVIIDQPHGAQLDVESKFSQFQD